MLAHWRCRQRGGLFLSRFCHPSNGAASVEQDIGQGHYIPKLPGNNPSVGGYVEKATITSMAISGEY